MERKTFGWILLGVGAAAAAAGIYFVVRSRKGQKLLGGDRVLGKGKLPRPAGQLTDRGYVLTHYRKDDLPIEQRVAIVQDLIHKSAQLPAMRKLALQITQHCPARDAECESRAIYDWMKANVRYTGDVAEHKFGADGPFEGVDLFQRADRTVEFRGGDCDDGAILDCTLSILNGLPCRLTTTSPTRDGNADDYTHILPAHGVPKTNPTKWIPADWTLPGDQYGRLAPHGKKLQFVA